MPRQEWRQHGYRQARRAVTAWGRLTAPARVLPDFLIVGAQRCGTTSLFKSLAEHPDVIAPGLTKGVHFFDTDFPRGLAWYRSHFPSRARMQWHQRREGARPITGEASPYYMFHPAVSGRIARDLPGVKAIALLRDPVERAYSAYTHERARGFENMDFLDALAAENDRLAGESERLLADPAYVSRVHQHNAYLARGRYADQLRRLEADLGRDNLLVLDADDLFSDFAAVMPVICDFLGLRPWVPEEFEQRNARPRSKLEPMLRERLRGQFDLADADLAQWWGRTPSWRR